MVTKEKFIELTEKVIDNLEGGLLPPYNETKNEQAQRCPNGR